MFHYELSRWVVALLKQFSDLLPYGSLSVNFIFITQSLESDSLHDARGLITIVIEPILRGFGVPLITVFCDLGYQGAVSVLFSQNDCQI